MGDNVSRETIGGAVEVEWISFIVGFMVGVAIVPICTWWWDVLFGDT